jgi:hypothetical protein
MMNRILLVILAVILIIGMFTTGCGAYRRYLAPIEDEYIAICADGSSPRQYFLYVDSGEPSSCDHFDSYSVTRADNTTIRVEIFNVYAAPEGGCADVYSYVGHIIPLGSDFVPGISYTVEVNDVTETFVAGDIMIYLAPIDYIDIWADNSSPPQYFLYVVSVETDTCEHFDSYNMTRANNTTIIVEIFNRICVAEGCFEEATEVEHTIPLGSDFVTGRNYTVKVNDVTQTFVA